MSCREISPEVLRNARTLEDVYTALGVLRPSEASSTPIAPPRTFLPEGSTMTSFPYLTGTDGRNFSLGPLFANDREAYTCTLTTLGYDEARGQELATESAEMNDEDFENFESNLSASDALSFNIYRTLAVMDYMRTDPPNGNLSLGGNTDGNRDVISAEEVENWAWERTGHNDELYRQFGGDAIGRLHAFLGIATLLASNPVSNRSDAAIMAGTNFDVTAPEGGWRSGDRVLVDTTRIDGAPASGSDAFRIQGSALSVGSHTVEIRRTDGSIIRTAVTVNQPEDPSFFLRFGSFVSENWGWPAALVGLAASVGVGFLLGRNRGASNPGNSGRTERRAEVAERRGPPPLPNQGGTAPVNVEVKIDNSSDRTESRSEGRGSNPPPPAGGTADYGDVLSNIAEEAPGEGVLDALGEGDAPAPSANPFAEIMTYTVNDASIESSLRAIDPALADFYRANISNAANPVTNMSDLITRIAITNPEALTQTQAALTAEGRPATEMSERVVFELISRAADWNPADAASRPALATRFETAVRGARGVDRAETTEAREARERRERERVEREHEARSPVR